MGYLSDAGCYCQEAWRQSLPLFAGSHPWRLCSPVLSYSHPPTGPTDGLRGIVATRALNLLQECELNIPSSSDPRWSPFVGLPPAKPLACSHPLPYPTFLG